MMALDAGAEDFVEEEDSYEILTTPENFSVVREALEKENVPMVQAEITMIPQNYVELTSDEDKKCSSVLWTFWMRMMMCRMYITMSKRMTNKIIFKNPK